jgi:hypothetical protein
MPAGGRGVKEGRREAPEWTHIAYPGHAERLAADAGALGVLVIILAGVLARQW